MNAKANQRFRRSTYVIRLLGGLGCYVLGLILLNRLGSEQWPHRHWLIFLPVLSLIYIAAVCIRYVSELDELWRKVITEAMAFSGLATGLSCFSYLFFRDKHAPEFRGEWAFYLTGIYYGIGLVFSWRRYR